MADAATDVHSYTGYNKYQNQSTLVGNWVEERALKAATGTHRYKAWVDTSLEVTLYPKETHRDGDSTAARVMVNADALPPTAYVTHMQEAYSDPSKHSEYLPAGPAAGKRTAAKLAAMMRQASAEPEAEERKMDFTTTSRAAYVPKPMTGPLGRRVMKTQDGVELPPEAADRLLQKELGIVSAGLCGRLEGAADVKAAADAVNTDLSGVPCTIYSDGIKPGVFPMSDPEHSANPFARTSVFSKPMTDPMKITEDCM